MNFAPFTGQLPNATTLPTIHQFAAKFGYEGSSNGVVQETRYQAASSGGVQFAVAPGAGGGVVDGVKFRQAESVVVVSAGHQPGTVTLSGLAPVHTVNTGVKYQTISASSSSVNLGNVTYGGGTVGHGYVHESMQHLKTEHREKRDDMQHDLMATMMQQQVTHQATPLQQGQQVLVVLHEPKEAAAIARAIKHEGRLDRTNATANEYISIGDISDGSWQALGADYLSALPLPLHHLLKYSSDGKGEPTIVTVATNSLPVPALAPVPTNSVVVQTATIVNQTSTVGLPQPTAAEAAAAEEIAPEAEEEVPSKGRRKKKKGKEKKQRPKPGEIRLTTALDGSTLYCCPECHMAYPERGLLEQHLVGHTMERRFICDICNAALKRKDHLTRHKQSHNPERPHVCSVCLKAFKRKEQLTLHFVIHSGEKRHVCHECGKGFYRKDHLRKHTRSHIARRVKAELSQGGAASPSSSSAAPQS